MKTQFPEDLTVLSAAALEALRVAGLAEFDALYPKGDAAAKSAAFAAMPAEDVATLRSLKTGLTAVKDEFARRAAQAKELAELAATSRNDFATVTGTFTGTTDEDGAGEEGGDDDGAITAGDGEAPTFAADGAEGAEDPKVVAYATGQDLGVPVESPLTYAQLGKALDRRLSNFNVTPYQQAARQGKVLKRIDNFARFVRDIPEELMIREGASRGVVRAALDRARDERALPGGSLIASGGWGAPSQISYDRFGKLSSRDGLASFPEIGVEHGGLQLPSGSSYSEVYSSAEFISFTEEQDIAGEYAFESGENVEGTKPVYRIPATTWEDYRLRVDGVHIQAGILESRGYPQGISEEVAQVLDVHAHVINAKAIAAMVAGSTAVTFPNASTMAGAAAPLLNAIEVQVLHYRDTHRMELDTTLELKIPFWVKGALRADLAYRLGVDLLDVSDQRINGWFVDRGVSVEYVYDWQSLADAAASATYGYPATVKFSLYAAGTWIKGISPVISLDTMYDSTLLGTNDYTVMFTEEGWFLAKAGPDSRVITVGINPNGVANIGAEISRLGVAS